MQDFLVATIKITWILFWVYKIYAITLHEKRIAISEIIKLYCIFAIAFIQLIGWSKAKFAYELKKGKSKFYVSFHRECT